MAELNDKDLEQVEGAGTYWILSDQAGIGGGQPEADGAVWIGGSTNPISGSKRDLDR